MSSSAIRKTGVDSPVVWQYNIHMKITTKPSLGETMTKVILAIAFLIFLVVIGPIITIWALNILFPSLAIPFTWETWLAVVINT
jgi:hypothetical protein